jgi:ABC-type nitrate/sulfonate/bicarbonate transport system substrate-binding protein
MKRLIAFTLTLALTAALFTGCAPKPVAPATPKKVTVLLDWTPNTNHTGLYVAKDLKYYEAEGLDVEIIQPSAGSAVDLVAADKAQFGVSYQEEVTFARTAETPLPIKAIAAVIQHNTSGFASSKAKNITSPKDFENHTYGGWGSPVEEATLKALMASVGADYSKMKTADIGSMDFFAAQSAGIDFSWIFYGWDGIAAELKNYPINYIRLTDYDKALDYYTPVLITSDKLIQEDPELVKKFLRATQKGYQYCIDQPDKAAEILMTNAPELDKALVLASQKYLAKEYAAGGTWGVMKESVWQNYAKWLEDRKLIPKPLNTAEAYTNDYLPQ